MFKSVQRKNLIQSVLTQGCSSVFKSVQLKTKISINLFRFKSVQVKTKISDQSVSNVCEKISDETESIMYKPRMLNFSRNQRMLLHQLDLFQAN